MDSHTDTKPLVTIAIPNYNHGKFLTDSIQSALAQTYSNYEIVIVDNKSTDNSKEVIERFADQNSKIRPFFSKSFAPVAYLNWNRCLENAKGKYIVFLHSDDRLLPTYLEKCVSIHQRVDNLGYVMSEKFNINHKGERINSVAMFNESGIMPSETVSRLNIIGWHTAPVQPLFNTKKFREIGGYIYGDTFSTLLLNLKWGIGYLKEPLVEYRIHSENISAQMFKDKSLVNSIHYTKAIILNAHLPKDKAHLRALYPKMSSRFAKFCVNKFAIDSLIAGDNRTCLEYLYLAASYDLDIRKTPKYEFIEKSTQSSGWTRESLNAEWEKVVQNSRIPDSKETTDKAPFPLPAGSLSLEHPSGELVPTGIDL